MKRCFFEMRALLIIGGLVVAIVTSVLLCGRWSGAKYRELMKPSITHSRLLYIASRCDDYKEQHGVWPISLEQLRKSKLVVPEVLVDAWDRDVVFVPYDDAANYGRLISFGADGQLGGSSEGNQDLEVRFPVIKNETWNEQVRKSIKRPRTRFYGLFPYLPD